MQSMSVLWARLAVALYSLGLFHALLSVMRREVNLFRLALGAFYAGVILQMVSIVEEGLSMGHFPANDFYQSVSLCAFLIAALYLVVYWRYGFESLSVFIFPLVFILTLVGALRSPAAAWTDTTVRGAWLMVHVLLVLVGYAALLLTAVASVTYLILERQLKTKKVRAGFDRLPPLGSLDELMTKAMTAGFVCITLAVIAGSTWASIESGARWIGDPRIVISLVTWGLYLVMVFLRATAGWRGRKAALMVIALVGFSALTWAAHTGLRSLFTR
jgi:ABC-type uncharacterized transport system permease subunit